MKHVGGEWRYFWGDMIYFYDMEPIDSQKDQPTDTASDERRKRWG